MGTNATISSPEYIAEFIRDDDCMTVLREAQ
jgi:hypothetical protein